MRFFEIHLGDGAYAYMNDARQVVMYTSNGEMESNHIYLEPEVLKTFQAWAEQIPAKIRAIQKAVE